VAAGPVSDNAAGVACALEVARASGSPDATVLLLFDDGEEAGLLGRALHGLGRSRSIGAVVNLEARGTSGASFLFETSRDNAWLVRRAVACRGPSPARSSASCTTGSRTTPT
jgi:hypothetical protein